MAEGDVGNPLKKTNYLRSYDWFAAVSFLLIVAGLLYMVPTGLGVPDESFYVTIPHRLLQGDRLILDDWHVSQFSSFMQYLPVKLYYQFHGSLDGVILYLRYWYIALQTVTLLTIYPLLRRFGWKGAVSWSVFGMYVPVMVYTLNYYTLCLWPTVIVCAVLHFTEKLKAPFLVLLGVLAAIAVLAEPLISFCYFIYTIIVWFRFVLEKKRKMLFAFCSYYINIRYWGFITLGVFLCAGVFLPFLFRGSDPISLFKAIPYLFNGFEYDFSLFGGNIQTMKVVNRALELYGRFPAVLLAVLTLAAFVLQRRRKTIRPLIAVGLAVSFIYSYLHAAYVAQRMNHYDYYLLFYGLPLYLCGPAAYLLLEKREPRLWAFWCSGTALSVLLDISSAVILGVCGAIASIASLIWLFQLVQECAQDVMLLKKETEGARFRPKLTRIVAAVAAVIVVSSVLGNEAFFDVYRLNFNIIESGHTADYTHGVCDTLLTRGAYAGIRTTKTVAAKYNAIHDDLDRIPKESAGPVLIFDRFPYCYLYLDDPYATFSSWYVDLLEDDRLLLYYDIYPERVPEYIYVPKYDPYVYRMVKTVADKLDRIRSWFDCEVTEASAGYIVRVSRRL